MKTLNKKWSFIFAYRPLELLQSDLGTHKNLKTWERFQKLKISQKKKRKGKGNIRPFLTRSHNALGLGMEREMQK